MINAQVKKSHLLQYGQAVRGQCQILIDDCQNTLTPLSLVGYHKLFMAVLHKHAQSIKWYFRYGTVEDLILCKQCPCWDKLDNLFSLLSTEQSRSPHELLNRWQNGWCQDNSSISKPEGEMADPPGPYPCIRCRKDVRPRQEALQCDGCDNWQHRTCGTGIIHNFLIKYLTKFASHWSNKFNNSFELNIYANKVLILLYCCK